MNIFPLKSEFVFYSSAMCGMEGMVCFDFILLNLCWGIYKLGENDKCKNVLKGAVLPSFIWVVTLYCSAEPLKKKKRLDPAIIKHREERKKKRLEKQIRRLEKHARQLKPIEELEVPLEFLDGKK